MPTPQPRGTLAIVVGGGPAPGINGVISAVTLEALHRGFRVVGVQDGFKHLVTGDLTKARELTADFVSCLPGRVLEDDAMVSVRMDGGAVVRLWTSSVAIGRMHGLNIQVFGEKGGLRWAQEWPNQLYWTPLNGRTEIIERGASGLSLEAARASRVTVGHAEGMPLAFANIYTDLAEAISARKEGRKPDPAATHFPTATDGLRSIAAIKAAVDSAKTQGKWTDARPPSLR